MSIRVSQESTYKGNDRWNWSVWLEGTDQELNQIEFVDYILHPTFSDPLRHITDRPSKFRLNSAGWGEFMIYLNIQHTDGSITKRKHWLRLEHGTTGPIPTSKRFKSKSPVVYLSSSAADTHFASLLARALRAQGIEAVRFEDETAPSLPLDISLNSVLGRANGAVFLISDRPNAWMTREIKVAQKCRIPITPVIIGPGADVPEPLRDRQAVHLKSGEEIEGAARSIAERLEISKTRTISTVGKRFY